MSPGEIYGFLGPNGAGKSTTVHMLTTLLPPTAGTARVAGHDIVARGPRRSRRDRRRAAGGGARSVPDRPRAHASAGGYARHPAAEARRLGDRLIARVGLSEAADRKVGGYSGGMRRRLDLALALVHGPRVLFLDEPTTGLDVQSRTALWDEVARLSGDEGVTVFLTTQYLEEADALADRVGIIDTGKLVAEGTPDALKAEIGRPTVEAAPVDPGEIEPMRAVLDRFGSREPALAASVAVRLAEGTVELADVVRALDSAGIKVRELEIHAPTLDDVFLEKTGRRLEGAGDDTEGPETGVVDGRTGGGAGVSGAAATLDAPLPSVGTRTGTLSQVSHLARRSITRTVRQPIMIIPSLVFPLFLLAVNSSGLGAATSLPGLPDRLVPDLRARAHVHAGSAVRDHGRGQSIAADIQYGFFNRLQLTPLRGTALIAGQLSGVLVQGGIQAITYLLVGLAFGAHLDAGVGRRPRTARALVAGRRRLRLDRARDRPSDRQRRGGPGRVPAALRLPLPQLGERCPAT